VIACWSNASASDTRTFKDVAELWIKHHVLEEGLRTRKDIERSLQVYIYPGWGNLPFLSIRRERDWNGGR
jgi:hypothetical protein